MLRFPRYSLKALIFWTKKFRSARNSFVRRGSSSCVYVRLDKLTDARFLSTLEMKPAYWQMPMEKQSRPFKAFTAPCRGLLQFRRMPYGVHNASPTCQLFIDSVIDPELQLNGFVYFWKFCRLSWIGSGGLWFCH